MKNFNVASVQKKTIYIVSGTLSCSVNVDHSSVFISCPLSVLLSLAGAQRVLASRRGSGRVCLRSSRNIIIAMSKPFCPFLLSCIDKDG